MKCILQFQVRDKSVRAILLAFGCWGYCKNDYIALASEYKYLGGRVSPWRADITHYIENRLGL